MNPYYLSMVQEKQEQLALECRNYFPFPHPSDSQVVEGNHHHLTCNKDLQKRILVNMFT